MSYLQDLFRYDDWANRRILAATCKLPGAPARAIQLLEHINAAQEVWWGRLHRIPTTGGIWPERGLDACEASLAQWGPRWQGFLETHTQEELSQVLSYHNLAGEARTSKVENILRHVAFHGSYHRGQIATYLHQSGNAAPGTDYIVAVNEGLVE